MLRLVTINIWQEQGPWERRMELLASNLDQLAPDVVCLQEVRYVEGKIPNQAETLAAALKMCCTHEVAQPWGGGTEGVALLSRHPLRHRVFAELPYTEGRSRRVCLGAAVDLPGAGETWIFTTHLAYRLGDGLLRERQVLAVDQLVQEHRNHNATVLAGDFNAVPDSDEIRFLRGRATPDGRRTYFQDAFAQCNPGAHGYTWARDNPYTAKLAWLEPDRRLDYILVTPMTSKGAGVIHSCRVVLDEPSTAGIRCSDHYGLLAELQVTSGAPARSGICRKALTGGAPEK